eukprot:5445870-Prorocentrum_lima.AAC.1
MTSSLVGSEMCIRDSLRRWHESMVIELGASALFFVAEDGLKQGCPSVSYTHLTLPTICSV